MFWCLMMTGLKHKGFERTIILYKEDVNKINSLRYGMNVGGVSDWDRFLVG